MVNIEQGAQPPLVSDTDEHGHFVSSVVESHDIMRSNGAALTPRYGRVPVPVREKEFLFKLTIEKRSSGGLGVDLSPHDGSTLLVGQVKPGPLVEWNQRAGPDNPQQVLRGDRVVAVNGVEKNAEDILNRMRVDSVLTFTFRRLLDFNITVPRRHGEPLGLIIADTGSTLKVTRVDAGPVEDTNIRNGAELEVRPGDEICEVNGISGTGQALMAVMRAAADVVLRIIRPKVPYSGVAKADPAVVAI